MIYLDNGATSMPKPRTVVEAVTEALKFYASAGRGSSLAGSGADEVLYELREEAANMFFCQPEQVVLTTSATHGLNIAIKSLLKPGGQVVVSGMEHNAVMRPLYALGAQITVARGELFDREKLLQDFDRCLQGEVDACIMTHVSNVYGWILPVEEVAEMCRARHIPFVLDASQSAGTLPINMEALGCSFIAMPGHKGLLGPQGTGLLLCGHDTKTLMEGGTGSASKNYDMPEFLPDRLEPGTHNIPGAAALLAGMRYIQKRGIERIFQHEIKMTEEAKRHLSKIPGIRVYEGKAQSGVLSFVTEGRDCVMFGERLSDVWDIALRAGLHCAPLAHTTGGTLDTGTIRLSPGPFTRLGDIRYFIRAVQMEMTHNNL